MSAYSRRGPDPLEQGLDRLVSAGRQLVDGVSGARPGSRPPARGAARRSGSLPRLDELGRWVEDKLDWILEDEDDWREPWQEQPPARQGGWDQPRGSAPSRTSEPQRRRRPLEAISRRTLAVPPSPAFGAPAPPVSAPMAPGAAAGDWPDDDTFTVPRWQRPVQGERAPLQPGEAIAPPERPEPSRVESAGRPLPRSSRRRGL